MLRGELYTAFTPTLIKVRAECSQLFHAYNNTATSLPLLDRVNLLNSIFGLPPLPSSTPDAELQLRPIIEPPFHCDFGFHVKLEEGVKVAQNCTFIDTTYIRVGARTFVGPNVSFFSGGHPLEGALRNGTKGPEFGKDIVVGEDCYIGGNVILLPGVTIGRGAVVSAGAVVTKDVEEYAVVAGNPARVVRRLRGDNGEEGESELRRKLEIVERDVRDVRKELERLLKEE
ncbi:acetyltransferase, CysE/LacA/LpxA/NodL family [Cyathus striatus]|nr:acetyltransferase, CysE/LacA/LpxA/NodL family [Cyathus striatus]